MGRWKRPVLHDVLLAPAREDEKAGTTSHESESGWNDLQVRSLRFPAGADIHLLFTSPSARPYSIPPNPPTNPHQKQAAPPSPHHPSRPPPAASSVAGASAPPANANPPKPPATATNASTHASKPKSTACDTKNGSSPTRDSLRFSRGMGERGGREEEVRGRRMFILRRRGGRR